MGLIIGLILLPATKETKGGDGRRDLFGPDGVNAIGV